MDLLLQKNELKAYVIKQLEHFFPDTLAMPTSEQFEKALDLTLERIEYCFCRITPRLHFFVKNGYAQFNHLHSDSYSMFLYILSNSFYKLYGDSTFSSKLMLLNRALHSLFVSYKCELPSVFLFSHAVGTVLGNARYSNGLVVFQNVTVNSSDNPSNGKQPELGKFCFLSAGAKIIGAPNLGDQVTIGANVCINNIDIPPKSIVYNDRLDGSLIVRNYERCKASEYFIGGDF